jgi:hypothetical protein
VVSRLPRGEGISARSRRSRLVSSLPVLLPPCCHPGRAMNGTASLPRRRTPDSWRSSSAASRSRGREAAAATIEAPCHPVEPTAARPVPPPGTLSLASDRARVDTNLARKGLWRSGAASTNGGGELVRLLDATDQLGPVRRIDAGPPLGALAFDVIVWVCSRWRERGDVGERHVPLTLEAMAEGLGWRKGEARRASSRGRSTRFAWRPSGRGSSAEFSLSEERARALRRAVTEPRPPASGVLRETLPRATTLGRRVGR